MLGGALTNEDEEDILKELDGLIEAQVSYFESIYPLLKLIQLELPGVPTEALPAKQNEPTAEEKRKRLRHNDIIMYNHI